MWHDLKFATLETCLMVLGSGFFAVLLGLPLGVYLFSSSPQGFKPRPVLYRLLNTAVNIFRSIPFVILMIALIPITRFIMGSSIGTLAAMVPLTIAAVPFFARLAHDSFITLPRGLWDVAKVMGATPSQIVFKMMLPEAFKMLVLNVTNTLVNLVGYSAMAGAVGGGGLGSLAIHYGYQRFDMQIMLITVMILIGMVQGIQFIGEKLSK